MFSSRDTCPTSLFKYKIRADHFGDQFYEDGITGFIPVIDLKVVH